MSMTKHAQQAVGASDGGGHGTNRQWFILPRVKRITLLHFEYYSKKEQPTNNRGVVKMY